MHTYYIKGERENQKKKRKKALLSLSFKVFKGIFCGIKFDYKPVCSQYAITHP
jgi:hypothetical protein